MTANAKRKTQDDFRSVSAALAAEVRKKGYLIDAVPSVVRALFEAYKDGIAYERKRQAKNRERAERSPKKIESHGQEALGHPAGCRCYPHCDPSW